MVFQLVLLVVLLGGNYLYINWFIKMAEPGAKAATETRLGVGIERNILGSWTVPAKNLADYGGNKFLMHLQVFAINLAVMAAFVSGFLLEIIFLYVFSHWLFKGGA